MRCFMLALEKKENFVRDIPEEIARSISSLITRR
jgi:hypothetical protein